jgi:lipopolysaccharide transport system ATP-binding protein
MDDIAIRVEGIGKKYRIGKIEKYKTLRDSIASAIGAPFQRARKLFQGEWGGDAEADQAFWALEDISFEVKQGEVIGVIGGNGAGKSTLLKILSRIAEPTVGFAEIHGRVGSLLEVGTGFHPELTGRENTYLNGAILGMKQADIERKFDEIVAFSEVEKFIDTPVKHYSSGMYLRLAFSVAAHLEPEILLIDEVLAVGDAGFQKKCLGKMGSVAKEGRTVLFVSHNLGAITQLCGRVVQLEKGRLKRVGPSFEVVNTYLASLFGTEVKSSWSMESSQLNDSEVRFTSARLLSSDGQPRSVVTFNDSLVVEIAYDVKVPIRDLSVTFHVYDSMNNIVFESIDTDMPEWRGRVRDPGRYHATAMIPPCLLRPGRYYLSFVSYVQGKNSFKLFQQLEGALTFDVSEVGYTFLPGRLGIVSPVLNWKVCRLNDNGQMP